MNRLPDHRRRTVVILACAVGLVLGGVSLAFGLSSHGSSVSAFFGKANGQLTTGPAVPAAVDPALYQHYAILRRNHSASDTPPPTTATSQANRFGADIAQAHRALSTKAGDDLFVLPTAGGLCLASKLGRGEECVPTALALQGQAATSVICAPGLPSGSVEVAGLLPDGAQNVTARLGDGTTAPVEVGANVYVLDRLLTDPLPKSISWTDVSGEHATPTSMPSDAQSTRCADPTVRPELGSAPSK